MDTIITRPRWLLWLLLALLVISVSSVILVTQRYQFLQLGNYVIARCDRWTGAITFVNFNGKVIGAHPSFDPIRDGLAHESP